MKKEDILNAFMFRHTCEEFDLNKKISKEDFNFILATAHLSPSLFGFEPWHFVVVQDKQLRRALKDSICGASLKIDTASHFVLCLTMKKPPIAWDSDYIRNLMSNIKKSPKDTINGKGRFIEYLHEMDFNSTIENELFNTASKQCYIALGNMTTSAAMIGIDSCPIKCFDQQKTEMFLKEHFDIDTEKYGISYMVAFGHRISEPIKHTHRELSDIVSWK